MKKIFLLIFALSVIGISCQKEFEVGETNTAAYAGDWYYQVRLSDGSVYYELMELFGFGLLDYPFLTYNTASNRANEVWFDDQDFFFPIKSKFTLNGSSESFSSDLTVNELVLSTPSVPPGDRVDGKKVVMEENDGDYYLAKILEGKILKNVAIVRDDPQKVKADSIYVKFAFFGGSFNYTVKRNIKVTYVTRVVPTTPPTDSAKYDTTFVYTRDADFFDVLDPADTLIITGYRQTGFEVDYIQ